jgi:hypothetical protein
MTKVVAFFAEVRVAPKFTADPGRRHGDELFQFGPLGLVHRLCSRSKTADARIVAKHRLAVDRGGVRPKAGHGRADERITLGPVIAAAREQAHPTIARGRSGGSRLASDVPEPVAEAVRQVSSW